MNVYESARTNVDGYRDIMPGQVASLRGRVRIVDVREPHEFNGGHIPGAINHPLSRFDPDSLVHDKPVILICQAGGRSATALRRALAAGRQNIRHYAGGMSGWRARGGLVA